MRNLQQTDERTHQRALLHVLYNQAEQLRGKPIYKGFHQLVRRLMQDGLYGQWIHCYSANEIKWLGLQIKAERDQLLSTEQLQQYMNEFITSDYSDQRIGLPQERLMLIAMAAMQNEEIDRLKKVHDAYWVLSQGYITLPDDVMTFFGKTFHQRHAKVQPHSMHLTDSRIPAFLSSKVKEKHILVPDQFMEQVKACGSWLLFDRSLHQVSTHSLVKKKVSAIGLMKQLLASEGVVLHFNQVVHARADALDSYIQLDRVVQRTDLASVCTILIRLLSGIEDVWNYSCRIKVAGWEATIAHQRIGLHSEAAVDYIETVSNEINSYLETAAFQSGKKIPLRKASDVMNRSAYPATKHQQFSMIDRVMAEQRYTDLGGSVTLEKSLLIETAELSQLLMKAWSCGVLEVQLV
ncbi:hypothetical protein [Sporosarcina ureae]|uniref:hypothetical protein n=1 Tax=Sporosarcina ureae TaxID=1571 RepID=UPI0026EBD8D7|nr:hypothetical protein [Sporosarcina ureae]